MQNNTFAEQTGQMLNGADPTSALMMLGGMVGGSTSMSQLFNSGPSQRLATSGSGGGMFGNLFNMFGNNNQSGQSIMPGGDYNSATNQGGMSSSNTSAESAPASSAEAVPAEATSKAGPDVFTAVDHAPAAYTAIKNTIIPPKALPTPPAPTAVVPKAPIPAAPAPVAPTAPIPKAPIPAAPIPAAPIPTAPIPKAPGGLLSKVMPAVSSAGKTLAKAAPGIGIALETGSVGYDVYNKGWDNTTNDAAQNIRNIASGKDGLHTLWQAPVQILNPVANAQLIAGGTTQTAQMIGEQAGIGAEAIRDKVTGTDSRSRASVADKSKVNAMEVAKQKDLEAQKAKLQQESQNTNIMAPSMIEQNKQEQAGIDAQIGDAKTRQENTADETAKWRLGQQNWFGSGGHKFRDAMQNSVAATDAELAELKAKGELDAGGQARQEQLLNRQAQRKQMLGTYDREGGASGKGLFSADMRNRVSGLKENIVAVGAKLRDPSLPPEERAKLEAQLKDNNENLAEYRGWAESSK
jgi:hypothetical protein